jgi:tRNA A37 threonylcarbamoyladenosine biosynthesis protein TsaE
VEEYLDSGCYCFLEWPGLVQPLIETSYFSIQVSHLDGMNRVIEYHIHDRKEENGI